MGEKVPTSNGKTRPAKIDVFRFTSRDRQVIEAAASLWGGNAEPWTDGPGGGQWQVRSKASQIPVIVPPGDMSFNTSYEQWTAGGCQIRCDGRWDHVGDVACHCDPEDRECKITSRLSLIVPDLPGIGVWRLESHGYYAAVELGGVVDLCATQAAQGNMLPARLRLEHREVKRTVDGKIQTFKFVVPVLDLDVHPLSLAAGTPAMDQLPPMLIPVPQPTDAERALIPSVQAQIAAVDTPATRESRQATLPPTGLKPRPAAQFQGSGGADDREAPDDNNMTAPDSAVRVELDTPPEPANNSDGDGAGAVPARTVRDIAMKAGVVFRDDYEAAPHKQKTRTVERLRHALTYACTKGQHTSLNDLDTDQLMRVWQRLEDISAGNITYRHDPTPVAGGVTFTSASGKETTVSWADIEPEDPA